MKSSLTANASKLFSARVIRVCVAVFLMASLLVAWQTAIAASPFDAPPASAPSASTPVLPFGQPSPFGPPSSINQSPPAPTASSKPGAPADYVPGSPTYTAKKATTMDGLMKEVYPNSPLNGAILNKALLNANPKLLNSKANQSIQRGATLNIPNHTQLIVQTLAPFAPAPPPPPMAFAPPPPPPEANQYGSQSSDPSSRRLWVRFP